MDIEATFAGMAKAQLNGKGNYMGEGVFLVETKVIKVKDGYKGRSFIFEFEILESTNEAHAPGSTGSWVIKLDKAQAFGDIKAMIFALAMDLDPKTVKSPEQDPETHAKATQLVMAALEPDVAKKLGVEPDFLIGLPLKLETVKIKTGKGGDFTVHNWSPAPVKDAGVTASAA